MAGPWPFLGRDAEHLRVLDLVDTGSGALLLGVPGVGKSALVRALRASLGAMPVGFVAGRAVSDATPFEAFAQVLPDGVGEPLGAQPLSVSVVAHRVAGQLGVGAEQVCGYVRSRREADVLRHGSPSPDRAEVPGTLVPRAALLVDDIHLLDDLSAQVVLALAALTTVVVIGTAPGADALPAAVGRLWRDGLCECVELAPLDDDAVEAVLEEALEGPVDEVAVRTFITHSQGNPLALRELVTVARSGGGLRRQGGRWMLAGPLLLSSGIRAAVTHRLAGLEREQRAALEALAATEPLPVAAAERLIGARMLDHLEAERLVVTSDELSGPVVGCAHPLYGDVLRESVPRLRRHRLQLAAATALEAGPAPTAHQLVRAALWRLEAGRPDTPARLLAAAHTARSLSLKTAERLARAAYQRDPSPQVTMALVEILTYRNKFAEAQALTARLPPERLTPEDRDAIAYCNGIGQGLLAGDAAVGTQLVEAAVAGSVDASNRLRALHSALLAFDTRFDDSVRVGSPVVHDPSVEPSARAIAGLGVVGSAYWLGQTRRAVAEAALVPYDDEQCREAVPFAGPSIELVAICALVEEGALDEAGQWAQRMRSRADAVADPFAGPRARYCQARVAMARGRSRTALRLLRHSMDLLTPFDRPSLYQIAVTAGRAAATHGDLPTARTLLHHPDAIVLKPYEPEGLLAQAAVRAVELRLTEAADLAAWAGGIAVSSSQWNAAALAFHDAARYGIASAVLDRLSEAAAHVDGMLAACYVRHARALAAHDGSELVRVARDFEESGLMLWAAEAAAESALTHAAGNDTRPARASAALARTLFAQCEGAIAPWLAGATEAVPLTERERQVAALAAAGCSDAAIAERLGISRRTVETHLAHAYAKLGITSRTELTRTAVVAT